MDSDSEWSDVAEESEEEITETKVLCLFCDDSQSTVEKCVEHMFDTHNVNLKEFIRVRHLEFYDYVKIINYIRKNSVKPENMELILQEKLADEKWLIPVLQDDMLLQFDVDSILVSKKVEERDTLKSKLAVAEERANLAEEFLNRTLDDLSECKKKLQEVLLGGSKSSSGITRLNEDPNSGYFGSYSHYSIHEEMLKDKVRTESYQKFILSNADIFQNSSVLDVGCGTSILSMFSAKAGAKRVIGIDFSEIAYKAIDIVKENELDNIIEIIKDKAEDIEIKGKVDVIISEWMGYFLIFESMLDTIVYCRDNYLSPNGCVYPDKFNIKLLALGDDDLYSSKVHYWKNVYDFRMTTMKSSLLEEPLVQNAKSDKILSEPSTVIEYDIMSVKIEEIEFDKMFQFKITKVGIFSAIVGYFDVGFERNVKYPVYFSTCPFSEPTHWKQTIFLLKESFSVNVGDIINGRMFCKKNKKDHRALDIAIYLLDNEKKEIKLKQYFVLG